MNQRILFIIMAVLVWETIARAQTSVSAKAGDEALYLGDTPAQHDARMKWFREARFGMFVHFGLYSQAGGEWNGQAAPGAAEWIENDMNIPGSQYASLVPRFNPEKLNADAWVKAAKDAGMKYLVITAKHHEGFALWPTELSNWSIRATPFRRDPIREVADACRRQGIKFCVYYSIMDWHSPLYAPRPAWNDAKGTPDMDAYVAYMKGQLKELFTRYGPIGEVWFDGCWDPTWTRERGRDLYAYMRSLQPDIVVNNRVGFTVAWQDWFKDPAQVGGDYGTPEQAIPVNGFGPGLDWEACMTMNGTWGYKKSDDHWKSAQTLVRNLVDCASKGGNYLLNVGPTGEGLIPQPSLDRLREVGQWMKVNGEAIYGTSAGPLAALPWGRCTMKAGSGATRLYLHVFDWPADGKLLVPGLENRVRSAVLLEGSAPLQAETGKAGVTVTVPAAAPSALSSTVVLEIEGAPSISPAKAVPPS